MALQLAEMWCLRIALVSASACAGTAALLGLSCAGSALFSSLELSSGNPLPSGSCSFAQSSMELLSQIPTDLLGHGSTDLSDVTPTRAT